MPVLLYKALMSELWLLQKVLSLEKVQQDILSWDLVRIRARFSSDKLSKVPSKFEDFGHYSRLFWRLMHEELRAHIQQVNTCRS